MSVDYISSLEHAVELCDQFKSSIEYVFFDKRKEKESSIPNFCWSQEYRYYFKPVKACVQLCQILKLECFGEFESSFYEAASSLEDAERTQKLEDFRFYLEGVRLGLQRVEKEMSTFCSAFDGEEKERINEAIHSHIEDCKYACVAMSVSAVESRLLKLMCLANLNSELELEKKTLGQLIFEYVENKDKYKNVVPDKHEPLLELCNKYRTFSVHPKKHKIKRGVAVSILNLAIEFLTDQDTRPEVVEAQLMESKEVNEA